LDILKIWEGGLASHGGAAGVLIAIYAHSRRHKDQPFLWMLDRAAVPTALAASLIRTGNVFNSEILGRPADVPWAFVFARVDAVPRHPAQLYEALAYLVIFVVLLGLYFRWRADAPQGALTGWFLVLIFTARFLIEFVKEPQATYENDFLITVGQWLSVPFILAGIVLIWRSSRLDPRPATPAPVKKAE
jgi:prolipoprotein diacylglyceryl transferase